MRRLILALVGVAVPAMAQDREAWAERRAARAEERQQEPRTEQGRQVPSEQPRLEQPAERPRAAQPRVDQPRIEQVRVERPRAEEQQLPQRAERPRIDWRQAHQGLDGQHRIGERDGRQWNGRRDDHELSRQPSEVQPQPGGQHWTGRQHEMPQSGSPTLTGQQHGVQHWVGNPAEQRWSNNWQRDPRYDWRRYRERNRSLFRIGSYYDPFGWGYRRVSSGFTLYAGYYSPDYWLDDPWQYRLPPIYGPYRWVRYFDDAVLVDIYSGQVVQVIRSFFW